MRSSNLYIKYVSDSVTEEDLTELFTEYGAIKEVKIVRERGMAFIEMERQMDAEAACKGLNRKEFHGRTLQISEAVSGKKRRR